MPWIEFEKSEKEIEEIFAQIFDKLGCVLFEAYSVPGSEIREFNSSEKVEFSISSLIKNHGAQLSIWCSNVMPKPQFRRISLNGGGSRQAVDGCGLFSLQLKATKGSSYIMGKIGYFTESAANNKYSGLNGPELVNWGNHKQVVNLLKKL